jgi:hypothetical protein
LHFNFALEYVIRRFRTNEEGLKFNCAHQLSFYADDILGESMHAIKESTEALVVASKQTGPEVNAKKNKNTVTCQTECRTTSQHKGR